MFKKVLGLILLPTLLVSIAPLSRIDNVVDQKEVKSNNEIKSDNPNNHEMIFYNDSSNWAGEGSIGDVSVVESSDTDKIQISLSGTQIIRSLVDDYTAEEFYNSIDNTYLTLYDVTDGSDEQIGIMPLEKSSAFHLSDGEVNITAPNYPVVGTNDNAVMFWIDKGISDVKEFGDDVELEEFHDYKIGFNVNPGDDLNVYSNTFSKDVPKIEKFDVTPLESSLIVNYVLSAPVQGNIKFEYNDLFLKINKTKYDLNTEAIMSGTTRPDGTIIIEDLNPATEYEITFGYDVDKVVDDSLVTPIYREEKFVISTVVSDDYELTLSITISLFLLIILLIIILILIFMFAYWNYQRRKISGLALVVGEDNEAYDPVYQTNYYQEEQDDNNQAFADQYDEVQDNKFYQDEEIAGYFDEVYDDESYDIDDYTKGGEF